MKMTITSTKTIIGDNNCLSHLWQGVTEDGNPCAVLVYKISTLEDPNDPEADERLIAELTKKIACQPDRYWRRRFLVQRFQ